MLAPEMKQNNTRRARKAGPKPRRKGGRALTFSNRNDNLLSQIVEPYIPLYPPKCIKTLRYASGHIGLSSTSGVVQTQVFSLNGPYDPDITGTGHQPMGFDQMMQFYNHYCVLRTRCVCRFGTATGNYGTGCLRVDAATTPITDIERIMEFGGNVTTGLEANGAFGANKVLSLDADIARLQGITPSALMADNQLRGDVASNPAEQSYLHVQLWNAAGVTVTCNIYVMMEFDTLFMEPRTAPLS